MQRKPLLKRLPAALLILLLAGAWYLALALLTAFIFAERFPPSGHPPLPAAPAGWYQVGFLVFCPGLALALGLGSAYVLRRAWQRRRRGARASGSRIHT
ncbi:MAG TPA: hypothetical protein VFS67_13560 [Polyangiaceae bacterium]|jgi:hypothetical protein|nr:hypothetical protein [Polyangiaceae bacterium]